VLRYIFLFFSLLYFQNVSANFIISEVFPNTIDDKNLEYIEVTNIWGEVSSLSWFSLSDASEKEYIIPELSIAPGESHRFIRSETKLILNNINEMILLFDTNGEVLDTISYTDSEKGVPISFLEMSEVLISDEAKFQAFFSDEAVVDEIIESPAVWEQDMPIEEVVIEEGPVEVLFDFQQPSYILETASWTGQVYTCDPSRDSCRVNFTFLSSFPEEKQWGYICETDFWFETGQENRCNPNTVSFPYGTSQVEVIIRKDDDSNVFLKREFSIIRNIQENAPEMTFSESAPVTEWIEPPEIDATWPSFIPELVELPEILYNFQQPSYITETSLDRFTCDASRETCRVNLDLRQSFTWALKESNYMCSIDFWFESDQSSRCNPNTVDIPLWKHEIVFRIADEDDVSRYVEHTIYIVNTGFEWNSWWSSSSSNSSSRSSLVDGSLVIVWPQIHIQSWIDENSRTCLWDTCKINLEYEKRNSQERCIWKFGKWKYSYSTRYRCNPGYVEYEPWKHTIELKVYESSNQENYKETRFRFEHAEGWWDQESEQQDISTSWSLSDMEIWPDTMDVGIVLQWKIWKNKTLSGSTITCITQSQCSINVTSELQYFESHKDVQYLWSFGDGTTSDRANPLSKKYPLWEYTMRLFVMKNKSVMDTETLHISVISTWESMPSISKQDFVFTGSLQIHSALINPMGRDIKEWIELENIWPEILLDSCFLKRGSKKYYFADDAKLREWEKLRVFRVFSGISLPNSEWKIELFCWDNLQDTFVWGEKISEWEVLYRSWLLQKQSHVLWDDIPEEYIQEISYIRSRVLKSGVKIYGEALPDIAVSLVSSQWQSFNITTNKYGIFSRTFDRWFRSGDISFTGTFVSNDSEVYTFTTWEKELSWEDISNFQSKYIKKTRKSTAKKEGTSSLVVFDISQDPPTNSDWLTDFIKYMLVFWIFLVTFFLFSTVFLLCLPATPVFSIECLMFSTRQKLCIII